MNWNDYPDIWRSFSYHVRCIRAHGQCECTGQCGKHQPKPYTRRCCEVHRQPAKWFQGRVILTVAHLCTCRPPCANPDHVIAACQRCHLRIDRFQHAKNRLKNQADALPWHPANPR